MDAAQLSVDVAADEAVAVGWFHADVEEAAAGHIMDESQSNVDDGDWIAHNCFLFLGLKPNSGNLSMPITLFFVVFEFF